MAYVIAEPCIDHMDQSCVAVCPVDCITADPTADRKFYIDPRGCIECGACEAACPNGAIYPADALPPEWADYEWVDAAWYRDPAAARTTVEALLSAAA
jgi:NAD-dependent dihydropyrimidine dehydrogenase PreA subunit